MNSLVIMINVIKRMFKEISAVGFLLILPVIGGILAIAITSRPAVIDVGIADISGEARGLVKFLNDTGKYNITGIDGNQAVDLVKERKIRIGIVLPENTEAKNAQNREKARVISLNYDPSLLQTKELVNSYMDNVYTGKPLPEKELYKYDTSKSETASMALGFLLMFMIMFSGTGMGLLLEDRRAKTFMRISCAPLREYQMVLGNLLANLTLGVVQITVFFLSASYILKIDWGMPSPNVLLILLMFLVTSTGLGIGLAGIIRNNQVFSVVNVIVSSLTCMLGGCFFSHEMLKGALGRVSEFIPQKWAMEAFDKMMAGASIADIQMNLWILLLFGAVFFTFGVKVLKPTAEDL